MEKRRAVIVDLDGTLCNIDHRMHYLSQKNQYGKSDIDWANFHGSLVYDSVNEWCKQLIQLFYNDYEIVFLTGRPEAYRGITIDWLSDKLTFIGDYYYLHMRPNNDFRMDWKVKKQIYEEEIKDKFDVLFVVEDRLQVVQMWRQIGVTCLQCAHGDY